VDNPSVETAILNQSVTAVVPGSWAYVRRGQPNEDSAQAQTAKMYVEVMKFDTFSPVNENYLSHEFKDLICLTFLPFMKQAPRGWN